MGSLNTTLHSEIVTLLLQQWFVIEIDVKVYRSNKSTVRHSQLLTDNWLLLWPDIRHTFNYKYL